MRSWACLRRTIAACALLAAGALQAAPPGDLERSQARWDPISTIVFEHINNEQGLKSAPLTALAQDGDGFVWVGSQAALGRWDGHRFRMYAHDPARADSVPAGFVQTMLADSKGRLWIGTSAGGLARYDRTLDNFVRYPAGPGGLLSSTVMALAADDGAIWIGTPAGLDRLDLHSGAVLRYRADAGTPGSLPDNHIRSLKLDRRGRLWVGSASGLAWRDPVSGKFTRVPLDAGSGAPPLADSVLSLAEDSSGTLWFGTLRSGIGSVAAGAAAGTLVTTPALQELRSSMVLAILEVSPGRLWIASYGGGITDYEPASGRLRRARHQAAVTQSLAHNRTAALLRDRSGLVWVAAGASLDRHDPRSVAIRSVFGAADEPEIDFTSVFAASDGTVWLGAGERGLRLVAPDGSRNVALRPDPARPERALPARPVLAMAEDHDSTIWIGTTLGLYRSGLTGESVARVPLARPNPFPRVGSIVPANGRLWLATGDGLLDFEPATGGARSWVQGEGKAGGLLDSAVFTLAPGPGRQLWAATRTGLNRVDPEAGTVEHIVPDARDPGALASGQIAALASDRQGRLWVGHIGGGISVMQGRDASGKPRFRHLGIEHGLPSPVVLGLIVDAAGMVWASGNDGLFSIDPVSMKVRVLHRADGMAVPAFYMGALARSAEGDLLFGGSALVVLRPELLRERSIPAPVVLTAVQLGTQQSPPGRYYGGAPGSAAPLVVTPDMTGFSVEFAALDYSAPARNRYAYRLEGFDQAWTESDASRRTATYTSLAPGSYALLIRGSNRNGHWSEPLRLAVEVVAPWYRTWWAYVLYGLAWAGAITVLLRWRLRKLARANAMLELRVRSRTAHLEKMNAIVKSINSQLSFEALLEAILRECAVIEGVDRASALVRAADSDEFVVHGHAKSGQDAATLTAAQAARRYSGRAETLERDVFLSGGQTLTGGGCAPAVLGARVCIDGQVEGYFIFENLDGRHRFDQGDVELLTGLQEHFVTAFQKARAMRQLEQARAGAEAATQAKSEFLANISHEIRTPMNAILGFAGLGQTLELEPRARDYFRKISSAGNGLLAIINDILDFSKVEAGKLELETVAFNLDDVLAQIGELFAVTAAQKNIALTLETGPGLRKQVMGDPMRLGQVLANLVGNAIKFTPQGRVRVRAEALRRGGPGHSSVRFTVSDSGVGISEAQLGRLFKPFAQADASTTREFGGTGLGLSISQMLVAEMGGQITVSSSNTEGSCFSFDLSFPRADPGRAEARDDDAELDLVRAAAGAAERLRGARVLLVDDNLVNQQVATEMLQCAGVLVDVASNGVDAVRMAEQFDYDAVLMDIQMPRMDGYEATACIREQPRHQALPIIAMTAHAITGYRDKCLAAGMNDFVTKPIAPARLFAALTAAIGRLPLQAPGPQPTLAPLPAALPESMAGIDTREAMQRLGGNAALLVRLLHSFASEHGSALALMRALIEAGQYQAAQQLMHTLNGAAGNLSASALCAALRTLDAVLDHPARSALAEALDGFEAALEQVLSTAHAAQPLQAGAVPVAPQQDPAALAQVGPLIRELRVQLRMHSPDAEQPLAELKAILQQHQAGAALALIEVALLRFDFATALVALDRLSEALASEA
ncbi:MAG: two-component regulator propeller domain-containing protein [Pseudomonadota bacterium]